LFFDTIEEILNINKYAYYAKLSKNRLALGKDQQIIPSLGRNTFSTTTI
jgi:hypothetical protein